jgi:hypothetical protein
MLIGELIVTTTKIRGCMMKSQVISLSLIIFIPIIVVAGVINVPGDQETIQEGINAAINGDTVLVAEGTYVENINFQGKAITVASQFLMDSDTSHISNTIIDGSETANPDSGSVVYFISGEDTTSILYGFTISGGTGTITDYSWQGEIIPVRAGGGILCYKSGAQIAHNKILNNHVPESDIASGGGIDCPQNINDAHVIIDHNLIGNNSVSGMSAWSSAINLAVDGTIKNNTISYNSSYGDNDAFGAVGCWTDELNPHKVVIHNNRIIHNLVSANNFTLAGGIAIETGMEATVTENEISYNELTDANTSRGGGIYLFHGLKNIVIDKNIISHNLSAQQGGGISLFDQSNNTLISNNIISENSASSGGGIHNRGSRTRIINNTILDNISTSEGGGYYESNSLNTANTIILNTILWGNQAGTASQIQGSPEVVYSNIEGEVMEGEGNISIDPMFEEDTLYHLLNDSPCIVAGVDSIKIGSAWYHAPSTDWSGNQRPLPEGSMPDLGAHENEVAVAYAHHLEISKTFVEPAIDSVMITVRVENPNEHNLSVSTDFHTTDNVFVESLTLFDDGMHGEGAADDDMWGNYYIPGDEQTVKVSVTTNDNTEEISRTRPNLARFTSIGPIVYDTWVPFALDDSIANPGDLLAFNIHIKNVGKVAEALDIEARLFSDDPRIEVPTNYTTYESVAAGATGVSSQANAIRISESGFSKDTTIYLPVTVSSGGFHFWDTFFQLDIIINALPDDRTKLPKTYALDQNYPNPFNPTTIINYELPITNYVDLSIYNLLGQKVTFLVNERQQAGEYQVEWDASGFSSGVYYYKIKAGKFQDVKKMVILK